MADIRATQSGDFSATSTWVGGVVPGSGDVAYANAFTVTISDTRTVQAISNAAAGSPVATVGGTFSLLNNANLTCTNANGVVQGVTTTNCITTPSLGVGSAASVAANIANTSTSGTIVSFTTAGTLSITGNITSPSGTHTILIGTTCNGVLNLTGNVTGGSSGTAVGISCTGPLTINATGNFTGGTGGTNSPALRFDGNSQNASVTINGNITGSTTCPAIINTTTTNTITINGVCQSSTTQAAISTTSSTSITRLSGPFLLGASGNINPVQAQSWRWAPTQIPTYMEVAASNGSTKRNLYTADNMPSGGYPVVGNVRSGTVYGPSSENTGTLAVPSASSVALGVAVDNTTGTAILTAANVRTAVGLASANLDTQFSGIPAAVWAAATRTLTTTIPDTASIASAVWSAATRSLTTAFPSVPSAADVASAVWSAATRTLTTTIPTAADVASAVWSAVTRTLTSNAAPSASDVASAVWSNTSRTITGGTVDTLTNAPTVPSAATIASQVRTELSTELGRIDVATSTRLAPSGTLARVTLTDTATTLTNAPTVPSAATIASTVRTELSVELARLDAAVSTRLASASYTAPTTPPTAATIASTVWSNSTRTITGGTIDNAPSSAPTAATVAAAVRSELTPELARVANCSTVDTTATTIQDALSPN